MYNKDLPTAFFQAFVPYIFKHRPTGLVKEGRDDKNNWTIDVDESIIKHTDVGAYRAFKDHIKFLPGQGIKSVEISDNAMLDLMVSSVVDNDDFAYKYIQDPEHPNDPDKQIKVNLLFSDIAKPIKEKLTPEQHEQGVQPNVIGHTIETKNLNIDEFLAIYDHAMTKNFD